MKLNGRSAPARHVRVAVAPDQRADEVTADFFPGRQIFGRWPVEADGKRV